MSTVRRFTIVAAALMLLLGVTVLVAYVQLGALNTPVAMLIALVKGALIALVFMNLRGANPISRLFALAGIFWLLILFALALSDFLTRH